MRFLLPFFLAATLAGAAEEATTPYYTPTRNAGNTVAPCSPERAFEDLYTAVAPIEKETVELFHNLWRTSLRQTAAATRAARCAALHRLADEWQKEGTTDARAFLLVDAQKRWNNHYCHRERDLIYDHVYRCFSTEEPTNQAHVRAFLQSACQFTPFDGHDALVLMDAINEVWPDAWKNSNSSRNLWRLWTDAAGYASAIAGNPGETTRRRLLALLHDEGAHLERHTKSGLRRWRYTYGKDLPGCIDTAMKAMRERHAGNPVGPETLERIEREAQALPADLTGFLPRCELAVEPGASPWKPLGDPAASPFLMPDTSAVTLPQWNDALLGGGSLEEDCVALADLAKSVNDADTLKALMAFSLAEGDLALPDGYRRLWMNVDGYDTFRYAWVATLTPHGIDIVVTQDGPRFSRDDDHLRALSRSFAVLLHRCILRLALLERDGKKAPLAEGCRRLATIFNQNNLWPLLCNEYCLRGVSPEAYVELLRSFESTPEILPAFAAASGTDVVLDVLRPAGGGEILPGPMAEMTRRVFIMNGTLPATDDEKRAAAAPWLLLAQRHELPGIVQYLCYVGRADVVATWDDIPASFISGPYSYAGYTLVKHALACNDAERARVLYKRMTEEPTALSYPETRLAKAALERHAGDLDRAERSTRDALVLTALRTRQGGHEEYAARHALIDAGLVGEAEKMLTLLAGRDNPFLRRELVDGMAEARRYESAAFLANTLLHERCLNATPARGSGTQAEIAALRLEADVYRALSLLKQGELALAHGMIERCLPLLEKTPSLAVKLAPHLLSTPFLPSGEREALRSRLCDSIAQLPEAPQRADAKLALAALQNMTVADDMPGQEATGIEADDYDTLSPLASPMYEWHLLRNGGRDVEILRAAIVRANYADERNRWISLRNAGGRQLRVTLADIAPEDIDHLIDWKKKNNIRSWKLKNSPYTLEGKLIDRTEALPDTFRTGGGQPASALLRLTFDMPYRVDLSWFCDEDRAFIEQWQPPHADENGPVELRTFATWQRAQAYAECHRLRSCAFVLGKPGGPEEEYFRKTVLNDQNIIRDLNRSCAVVVCRQNAEGEWDEAGKGVFRSLQPAIDCISPPGTSMENNPYRAGFRLEMSPGGQTFAPFPIFAKLPPEQEEFGFAIEEGNPQKVRAMLAKNPALMKTRFFNGKWSPLYQAIVSKRPGVVEVLLEKGADPNERDSMGRPMLMVACHGQAPRIVRILLRAGADPNALARRATHIAQGNDFTCSAPLDGCHGQIAIMDMLLKAGANPDGAAPLGAPPAAAFLQQHQLTEEQLRAALDRLVKAGADLNLPYRGSATVLGQTISSASPQRRRNVRLLLAAGADPNAYAPGAEPPLVRAASVAPDLIPVLIEAGADPNIAEPVTGTTALSAVLGKDRALARYLIEHGAKADAKPHGDTLLQYILYNLQKKNSPSPETISAELDFAEYLIAHGCPVNEPNGNGQTPLQYAREHAVPEAVDFLLAHGAVDSPRPQVAPSDAPLP